ncbi:MAG: ATP phosphoribosyltransferase regulatory subunit [Aquirhabdus sp.]
MGLVMPVAETWLLPDGVADILPKQARTIESLRQRLLNTLAVRGYALVYTPFIEYVESLLTSNDVNGSVDNHDLDLVTFKLIDQLTGRLIGVRADITPQVARIDAHVNPTDGVARYCYAATVLHTRPQGLSASRTPLQIGAELFGHAGIEADLEMIDLMLTVLFDAGLTEKLHLDLGHVAVFRALAVATGLNHEQEQILFDIYQRKSIPELKEFCQNLPQGNDFLVLGRLGHDLPGLAARLSAQARQHADVQNALEQLATALAHVQTHWPQINVGVDATELRGYHYHTGLVFAVYAPNFAMPLAKGGRYDGVGQAFGRARPATGFSCDLYTLTGYLPESTQQVVVAPAGRDAALLAAITSARADGHVVVQALNSNEKFDARAVNESATHTLVQTQGVWQVAAL